MHSRSLNILRAYWEALRDGRDLPRRIEVDPRGIGMALQDSFIAERIAPGQVRLRIAGTRLQDLIGTELRGMPLSVLIAPDSRDRIAQVLEQVFDMPALADCRLVGAPGLIRQGAEGRLLLLPLRGDDGRVNRLLGGLCHAGGSLRPPQRFELIEPRLTPAGIPAPRPAPQPAADAQPGLAEPPGRFNPAPMRTAATAPHLRLVVSRD